MNKLIKAESIDHFFEKIQQNPLNKIARQSHSYISDNSIPITQWLDNTEIITLHPTAEAGFPHTRPPNIICMPVYFPDSLRTETLFHELIHIDQRRRSPLWNAKFSREGWSQVDESSVPLEWLKKCRLNPDTIDQRFWSFKGRYVPLPLFERTDRPNLRDVSIQWWDIKTGIRQPAPPRLFLERYGSFASQPEHPRELSAVELSKIIQSPQDLDSYLAF